MTERVLAGRTAIVTGASRGVGRAIAERLGSLGANVVGYSSSEEAARSAVRRIRDAGAEAIAVKVDISSVEQIEQLFVAAGEAFGRIDAVVANAGVETVDLATVDVTEEQFDHAFAVNAKGAFFTLREAARTVADGGRIIAIGSTSTRFPTTGHALYGASKTSAEFVVEVLAKELGGRGITVNSVVPSVVVGAGVGTDGLRPAAQRFIDEVNPMKRAASLDDVADAVEFLVGTTAGYISGQHLVLSGGAPA